MIKDKTKEVYFYKWCEKCKFFKTDSIKDPCNDCLTQGWNVNSHKPVNFEEA